MKKILFILLSIFTIIIIVEIIYLFSLPSKSNSNQIKQVSQSAIGVSPSPNPAGPVNLFESLIRYYPGSAHFIKSAEVTITFSGEVKEITPKSLTLVKQNKEWTVVLDSERVEYFIQTIKDNKVSTKLLEIKPDEIKLGDKVDVTINTHILTKKAISIVITRLAE